jgi:indole-3-glycerol phosphate synthase
VLREAYDVAGLARAYGEGGASAISVLTSADFDGRLEHLAEARAAVALPLLRKDFIVDPIQLLEARASGADAVLLIVRILTNAQLNELSIEARELGLQTLVELYAEDEFETAVEAGPDLLGVNSRDLETFEVRPGLLPAIAASMPEGLALVAESGISTRADVEAAGAAGARAVLVGEALVRSADPAAKARELLGGS